MLSNLIEILILSLVQGISEFLPISSSAHLIIVSKLFEFESSSLIIDVGLHLGALLAIILFFKKELLDIKNNQKLILLIFLGTIPLIIVGYISYNTGLIYLLRDIKIIAWTTLIFGIILYFADKNKSNKKLTINLNFKTILFIGVFQIFALIPGVSRAGITMTAARFLKFNRVDSTKISFLLAIPALTGASVLGLGDILKQNLEINYFILMAIIFSFLISYFTIKFFLNYISKFSLKIFIFYRIIISIILFMIIYN